MSENGQFVIVKKKTNWRQFFTRLSCVLIVNFVKSSCGSTRRKPSGSIDYFEDVITKFIVNNKIDARKTDVNLLNTCILGRSC